jgi:hypothetical protein
VRRLAMLLEMTWTFSSWAAIPVAAVYKARMGQFPSSMIPKSGCRFSEQIMLS